MSRPRRALAAVSVMLTGLATTLLFTTNDRGGSTAAAAPRELLAGDSAPGVTLETVPLTRSVGAGDTARAEVRLRNGTDQAVAGPVTVAVRLTPGLRLTSAAPTAGSFDPVGATWTLPGLDALDRATLAVDAEVVQGPDPAGPDAVQRVRAAIAPAAPQAAAAGPAAAAAVAPIAAQVPAGQRCPEDTRAACASVVVGTPVLRLSRTADRDDADAGDVVTDTVTVTNVGDAIAPSAVVRNTLPAGAGTGDTTVTQGGYDADTGVWTTGRLAPGASAALTLAYRVPETAGAVLVGRSALVSAPGGPPVVAGACSDEPGAACSGLRVSGTMPGVRRTTGAPAAGGNITWTVTASNDTALPMPGASVREPLPEGAVLVGAAASRGAYDKVTGAWDIGDLAPGERATLRMTISQNPGGERQFGDAADRPGPARLQLVTGCEACGSVPGEALVHTVAVTNTGGAAAGGVRVSVPVPPGTTFAAAEASQGTYDPVTGVWNAGDLAPGGATAGLRLSTIPQTLPPGTAIVARAAFVDPPGDAPMVLAPCADDADASCSVVRLGRPDVRLAAYVDQPTAQQNDPLVHRVEIAGEGTGPVAGLAVGVRLPEGVVPTGANMSQGTYDQATGIWTVGDLAPTGRAWLSVTSRVAAGLTSGTLTASAGITSDHARTVLPGRACADDVSRACATTSVVAPRLQLTNLAGEHRGPRDGRVPFTVTVVNVGPGEAFGVRVEDVLPSGLAFVRAELSQGTYDPVSGVWRIGALAADGGAASLRLTTAAQAEPGTTLVNRAKLAAPAGPHVIVTPCADDPALACASHAVVAGEAAPAPADASPTPAEASPAAASPTPAEASPAAASPAAASPAAAAPAAGSQARVVPAAAAPGEEPSRPAGTPAAATPDRQKPQNPQGPQNERNPQDRPDRPGSDPGRHTGTPQDRPDRPSDRPDRPSDRPHRPSDRPDGHPTGHPADRPGHPADRPTDRPGGHHHPGRPGDRPTRPSESGEPTWTGRPWPGHGEPSPSWSGRPTGPWPGHQGPTGDPADHTKRPGTSAPIGSVATDPATVLPDPQRKDGPERLVSTGAAVTGAAAAGAVALTLGVLAVVSTRRRRASGGN